MKTFKPWLALILVFLTGAFAGIIGTRIVVRHYIVRIATHPELVRQRVERDLVRKLDLDSDQQAKVHQTLVDAQTRIRELRTEFAPRFNTILSDAQKEISAQLTQEQRQRFDRYCEQNKRFFPHVSP